MITAMQKPWYKHPMVWMVIAIPLSAVLAGTVTIYLAVTTEDGLVVDDYYKQGLAINRQIARDQEAARLQLQAQVVVDTDTGFVKVSFDKGMMQDYPVELTLGLRHATQQQQDNFITLQRGIDNYYVGRAGSAAQAGIREGIWHVEISRPAEAGNQAWRLSRRVRLQGYSRVHLQSGPAS